MEIVKKFESDREMSQWMANPKNLEELKKQYPATHYKADVNLIEKRVEVVKKQGVEGFLTPPVFTHHPHSKEEAQNRADEIANHLFKVIGGEWQTRVWHDLHFCYTVSIGSVTIWEHLHKGEKPPTYHAHISEEFKTTGAGGSTSQHISDLIKSTYSPEMAYVLALTALRTLVRQYTATQKLNLELLGVETIEELEKKISGKS